MKKISLKSKAILMFILAGLFVIINVSVIVLGLYSFSGIENRLWVIRKLNINFYQVELHLQTIFLTNDIARHQNSLKVLTNEIEDELNVLKLGGYFHEYRYVDAPPTVFQPHIKEIELEWALTRSAINKFFADSLPESVVKAQLNQAIQSLQRLNKTIDLLTDFADKQYLQARQFHDDFMVFLLIINLLAVIIAGTIFYKNLLKPLQKISQEISFYLHNPTHDTVISYQNQEDEIGQIAHGFTTMVDLVTLTMKNLRQITENSTQELQTYLLAQHPIYHALQITQKSFYTLQQQEKAHNWQADGITDFVNLLDNHGENLSGLAHAVLRFLTDYTKAIAGVFFIMTDDHQKVELTVSSGVDVQENIDVNLHGIIQKAIQEKKPILLQSPDNNLQISSGVFNFKPVATLVVPLLSPQGSLQGVLELVYDYQPADYQVRFFAEISNNIASAIAEVKHDRKTADMLRRTQELMHDLQMSEEELRQNMEELMASQEVIKQQMQRTEELKNELLSRMNVLDETAIVSESDLYGNITYVNKKLLEITGYTEEELIGKPHNILRHPDTPAETFREMWATIKSGKLFHAIIKNKKKDGSPYWVDAVVTPILDADKKIAKYISIRFDITDQVSQKQKIQELLDETAHQNEQLIEKEKQLRQSYADLQHSQQLLEEYNASLEEKIKERTAEIILQKENIESSIRYAKRIQQAMLPELDDIQVHIPECFIFYKPKDVVSGDFYWFTVQNDKIFVAAADCTGHGVPGGFMSMIGMAKLSQIINETKIEQASKILDKLHEEIFTTLNRQTNIKVKDGMDISLCIIDKKRKEIQFAGTHQSLLYFDADGILQIIKGDRNGIGSNYTQEANFTQHIIPLTQKPSEYYLFSDGITDQFGGEENKKIGIKTIKTLLEKIHTFDMSVQHLNVAKIIDEWQGSYKQTDDMLMIGMRLSSIS